VWRRLEHGPSRDGRILMANKGEQETGKSLNGKYGPERIPFQNLKIEYNRV
jgi:hypothetical protein